MNRLRLTGVCVALACSLAFVEDARAQNQAPTTSEMHEAETRFREGLDLYAKGQINDARVKLVQAYAVLGRTNILWNLSVAEFYSSRLLDSIRHMRRFVRSPDAEKADVKIALEKFIPAIERETARVKIEAPNGRSISIDGEEFGIAPLDDAIDVLPGKHQVIARGEHGMDAATIEPRAGQVVVAHLGEGRAAGDGAASRDAGKRGPSDGANKPRLDEGQPSGARLITSGVLLGGTVVAAGVGLVFLGVASGHQSKAQDLTATLGGDPSVCSGSPRPECSQLRDENHARDQDRGIATGFFIGAGVLAVSAVATYLFWPKSEDHGTQARFVPVVGPQTAGGAFVTTF